MVKLLSPAGNLEKLKYAVNYGADAVYLGGELFNMRAKAGNFSDAELEEAISLTRARNIELNIAANIFARNHDVCSMIAYLKKLYAMGADSFILSDPGIIYQVKQDLPDSFISLSTQFSTTNYKSIEFWKANGVDRVILARELSFQEIKEICEQKPIGMEIEIFIHGAMCISYSGRCLLSNYMTGRDSNQGDCAQPCRWQYSLMEKTREGQYFDMEESQEGTYIFNSKDLCLLPYIKDLIDIGVDIFKVEGRMKSIFYVSTVTNVYREAIRRAQNDERYEYLDLYEELTKVSHRQYTDAFYHHNADHTSQVYGSSSYTRNYDFVAEVMSDTDQNNITKLLQKNRFYSTDELEIVSPGIFNQSLQIVELINESGEHILNAPHPEQVVFIKTKSGIKLKKNDLLRRKRLD